MKGKEQTIKLHKLQARRLRIGESDVAGKGVRQVWESDKNSNEAIFKEAGGIYGWEDVAGEVLHF